jgi:hypothetical protein
LCHCGLDEQVGGADRLRAGQLRTFV